MGGLFFAGILALGVAGYLRFRDLQAPGTPRIPFPLKLGQGLQDAKAALGEPVLDQTDGPEKVGVEKANHEIWRTALWLKLYEVHVGTLSGVSVSFRLHYRSDNGRIWRIRVFDPASLATFAIEGLPACGELSEVEKILGKPIRSEPADDGLVRHFWRVGDRGYSVDTCREAHSQQHFKHQAGEIHEASVCFLPDAPKTVAAEFEDPH